MNGYLIDTNSLITPHRSYYAFDFAENFWNQLKQSIIDKKIFIIRSVYDELTKNSDDILAEWIKGIEGLEIIEEMKNPEIISIYGKILQYIQECGFYKDSALANWSKESVADAWIIATAFHYQYKIITFEKCSNNLSPKQKSRNAKIPDVAKHFDVECIQLYDFMRIMKFKI